MDDRLEIERNLIDHDFRLDDAEDGIIDLLKPDEGPVGYCPTPSHVVERNLVDNVERIVKALVSLAAGDDGKPSIQAIKEVNRLLIPKETIGYVKIDIPDKMTPDSIMELTAKIIQMVGSGKMPTSQGERLMGMISVHLAAIETQILESDIRDLKTQHGAIISDHKARVYRINDLATARKALNANS
jgi:hypothetical protein